MLGSRFASGEGHAERTPECGMGCTGPERALQEAYGTPAGLRIREEEDYMLLCAFVQLQGQVRESQ